MNDSDLILDRYQPIGQAGSGGFGTVQIAWDPRIQRKVAIKTIQLSELDAARAALPGADAVSGAYGAPEATFDAYGTPVYEVPWEDEAGSAIEPVHALANIPGLDEARTAAMLADPRIVTVYDFEVRGQTAYLIMEFIDGLTLTELMEIQGGVLSIDEVTAVFDDVAGALTEAHRAGVLHLDIKPDNILINAQGQVKVTDFGLATLADAAGLGTTGGGTIGYMPLEQMRREELDARTDEWSLASVAYEMLTGTNPFGAPDLDHAEGAILDAELTVPSVLWDDLDDQLDDVLFYALDPDREKRYASVADFAEELDKFLGNAEEGHKELAHTVSETLAERAGARTKREPEPAPRERRSIGEVIASKLSVRSLDITSRAFAVIAAGFLTYMSVTNIAALASLAESTVYAHWIITLVIAGVSAVWPFIGSLMAYLLLTVALFASDSPVLGVLLLIALALWWWFVGRHGRAAANVALCAPLFGAVGGGAVAPLAAGAFLTPAKAFGTGAFTCVVALLLGSLGSESLFTWNAFANWHFAAAGAQAHLTAMITQPQTWFAMGGWIIGPFVGSLIGQFDKRIWDVLGVVLTAVVLLLALCLGVFFLSGFKSIVPPLASVLFVVIPAIVLCLAITVPKPENA